MGHVPNPTGIGGFQPGQAAANPGGRPKSVSQIQLYALARCREAIDVATRVMRQPKEGDNIRLRAAEMILDRGVGRPGQAVSLDVSLTKPLESMSVEELQEFRTRYAAIVTASPMLIEHVIESEQAEQIAFDLNDQGNANEVEGVPLVDEAAPFGEPVPEPRRRGRPRRQSNEVS
jgi:hypothetical protein